MKNATHYIRLSNGRLLLVEENSNKLSISLAEELNNDFRRRPETTRVCSFSAEGITVDPCSMDATVELTKDFKAPAEHNDLMARLNQIFSNKLEGMSLSRWNKYLEDIGARPTSLRDAMASVLSGENIVIFDPGRICSFIVLPKELADKILILGEMP